MNKERKVEIDTLREALDYVVSNLKNRRKRELSVEEVRKNYVRITKEYMYNKETEHVMYVSQKERKNGYIVTDLGSIHDYENNNIPFMIRNLINIDTKNMQFTRANGEKLDLSKLGE